MSVFDLALQENFAALITRFGREYTFTHVEPGVYDPGSDTTTDDIPTDYSAYAVRGQFSIAERNDSSIQVNDIKLIAEWAGYQLDDTVSIDGANYRIVNPQPVIPGDTGQIYILQVRK